MRRTSSSSERSLDPAYGAEYEYGQHPDDYPAPRSISPSKASPDRSLTAPIATPAAAVEAIVTTPDGGKGSGADGGEEDLEKLEEIVRKGEGIPNQLVIIFPQLSNQHHQKYTLSSQRNGYTYPSPLETRPPLPRK